MTKAQVKKKQTGIFLRDTGKTLGNNVPNTRRTLFCR